VRARDELDRRVDVRRALVRPAFARLALLRPAFDELGVRFEDDGARLAVEGVFDGLVLGRLLLEGACAGCLVDRFVDPDRAGLARFVLPLDRDAPPRDPPRR